VITATDSGVFNVAVMLVQGSESAGDSGGASSTAVVDLEMKMEDLRQALRKAQVFDLCMVIRC